MSISLPVHEDAEQLSLRTWVQLARTFYQIERRISAVLSQQALSIAQYDVLASLHYSEGLTQKELAELLLVTKGNVCGLLDRLEKQGWVERRPDREDGRTNRVHLTPHGRRKIEQALPCHDRLVHATMAPLGVSELRQLRGWLQSLEGTN